MNTNSLIIFKGFKAEVSREPTDIKVKFPSPPTPVPQQYQQVDAHQGQSAQTLLARKQQTQQYLEVSQLSVIFLIL